jgi:opacity protein-like surface antigen
MKQLRIMAIAAAIAPLLFIPGAASRVKAQAASFDVVKPFEASVSGGIHALNENDTALPEAFVNIPLTAAIAYNVSSIFAVEGEFSWIIPVTQKVDMGNGETHDMKSPDVLAYQANLRAHLPTGGAIRPYLIAGLGAVTFLSSTEPDRLPQLENSETAFAINFGTGLVYRLTESWGVRADFRELVAFPADDATGLSQDGSADDVWMERATLGVTYGF